jgi:dGTPase
MRQPFARDHDRVMYQGAFRRLQGKTQVVTPGEADFFRTRLTHTLEVAQIARRLADYLNFKTAWQIEQGCKDQAPLEEIRGADGWVDPDVCEASAILHDLGHPPFGHAGEEALQEEVEETTKKWKLADVGSFEGNAQSFRMAVTSLRHTPDKPGLQLTRAVLDTTLKYPWRHACSHEPSSSTKWSVYPTEMPAFEWVREDAPRDFGGSSRPTRLKTVEAQIVEWADDIAYAVHDLDDWFRAGFMPIASLSINGPELDGLIRALAERDKLGPGPEYDDLSEAVSGLFTQRKAFKAFREPPTGALAEVSDPQSPAAGEAIRQVRSLLFDEFSTCIELVLRDGSEQSWTRRYRMALKKDPASEKRAQILQGLLGVYVVGSHKMATHQAGQQRVVRDLMRLHADAAELPTPVSVAIFPSDVRKDILSLSNRQERLRRVVDFISGMTDAYAARCHARLTSAAVPFQQFL